MTTITHLEAVPKVDVDDLPRVALEEKVARVPVPKAQDVPPGYDGEALVRAAGEPVLDRCEQSQSIRAKSTPWVLASASSKTPALIGPSLSKSRRVSSRPSSEGTVMAQIMRSRSMGMSRLSR